jgi:hypothetical protein
MADAIFSFGEAPATLDCLRPDGFNASPRSAAAPQPNKASDAKHAQMQTGEK